MYNSVYINAFKEKSKNIDMSMTKEMLSINWLSKLLVSYNMPQQQEIKNYFETKAYYFEDCFHWIK